MKLSVAFFHSRYFLFYIVLQLIALQVIHYSFTLLFWVDGAVKWGPKPKHISVSLVVVKAELN